jgi:thiamine kinase-like enzyme
MTADLQAKTTQPETADALLVRLIILRRCNSEVFLSRSAEGYVLPEVQIPKWQRIAPHVVKQVNKTYELETICVFNPQSRKAATFDSDRLYQVLELVGSHNHIERTVWIPRSEVPHLTFRSPEEHQMLEAALQEADLYSSGELTGPFGKPGWIYEVIAWMTPFLEEHELELTNRWLQHNASPNFSLVRFETTGPAVWFKAVGEPNLREYRITTKLAESYPFHLPRIIAIHDDWHAWLMEEVKGVHPDETSDLEAWGLAVRALASLQRETLGNCEALLAIGCRDLRIERLLDQIPKFLDVVSKLMERQVVTSPAPLSTAQIDDLERKLVAACEVLQALPPPETLGHSDLNPGNIVVSPNRTVFLDWAEANVGHPFLTFEYLLAHLQRQRANFTSWRDVLRQAYGEVWKPFFGQKELEKAFRLTPIVAVYAYALAMPGWQDITRRNDPTSTKYLRSLVRRMYREAQAPELVLA